MIGEQRKHRRAMGWIEWISSLAAQSDIIDDNICRHENYSRNENIVKRSPHTAHCATSLQILSEIIFHERLSLFELVNT